MSLSVEAVLAIVFGICGVILAILGVILAYVTMNQAHRRRGRNGLWLHGPLNRYSLNHQPLHDYIPLATHPSSQHPQIYRPPIVSDYYGRHMTSESMVGSDQSLINNGHFSGLRPQSFRIDPRYPHAAPHISEVYIGYPPV